MLCVSTLRYSAEHRLLSDVLEFGPIIREHATVDSAAPNECVETAAPGVHRRLKIAIPWRVSRVRRAVVARVACASRGCVASDDGWAAGCSVVGWAVGGDDAASLDCDARAKWVATEPRAEWVAEGVAEQGATPCIYQKIGPCRSIAEPAPDGNAALCSVSHDVRVLLDDDGVALHS